MLDLAAELLPRLRAGEDVAVVTVTRVARSAPRGLGASMALTADVTVIGSISGGCVEGEAVTLALAVLADGRPRAASFGFSDERAHAAGLACGGAVEVLAYRISPTDTTAILALEAAHRSASDRSVSDRNDSSRSASVTIGIPLTGPAQGQILMTGTDAALGIDEGLSSAAVLAESRVFAGPDGDVLALSRAPRPRLIILGAGDHAAALCRAATATGFTVTVCDPWPLLLTSERFPHAELVDAIPHEYLESVAAEPGATDARTAICVLTHDERLDVPAIHTALGMDVGFVGAMGARSTVARRAQLLRDRGASDEDLARLHSPLGLDLGGASPEETALSVLAEIVAARYGGTARAFRDSGGPLHARAADETPQGSPVPASCATPAARTNG